MPHPLDLASRLTKRITLQQESATSDGAGGYSLTWQDVATVWAEIQPLQGNKTDEPVVAMQQEARNYARITIRYRSGVTPKLRVVSGSRVFNIISVINPGEANDRLVLLVAEGVAL